MRNKRTIRLFRFLVILLGIGLGLALAKFIDSHYTAIIVKNEDYLWVWKIILFGGLAALGGVLFFALSNQITKHWINWSGSVEKSLDTMPAHQVTSSVIGLILGLIVAALLCGIFSFLGQSMATTVLSALLYLALGSLGFRIGRKRSKEFTAMLMRFNGTRDTRRYKKSGSGIAVKLLDTSAIIDGRIFEICKAGFAEGTLVVPKFVVDELQHVADSSDESKRERGRRGLDMLKHMQDELGEQLVINETDYPDAVDVDVKLMRLAKQNGWSVVTVDYNLGKAAAVNEIKVLNVNELANAMRFAVVQGQELTVRILREGREVGQGLAYMNDGTMLVIEGGKEYIGTEQRVTVTSVLQTSAGRMVFARLSTTVAVEE